MTEVSRWGLIGDGMIGQELRNRLADQETAQRLGLAALPSIVARSGGVRDTGGVWIAQNLSELQPDGLPGVLFVAMPTTNDGERAYGYISAALERGARVVTAEKGAAANFLPQLREESGNFRRLGISATVGGGTRLLREVHEYARDKGDVTFLHVALNGTHAAMFSDMATGTSLDDAAATAVRLGYAEPGSASGVRIIRAEAEGDIPKKVGILFNYLGFSDKPFDWTALNFNLSDDQIKQAAREAGRRRFVVSIYPQAAETARERRSDIIGGFRVQHDGWCIVGGFQTVDADPALRELASGSGPANGFVIGLGPNGRHGTYSLKGPGAGPGPTVTAMLADYAHMKENI